MAADPTPGSQDPRRAESALAPHCGDENPFAAALKAASLALAMIDARAPGHPIAFANAAFLRLTGRTQEEVIGQGVGFLHGPQTDPGDVARTAEAIARGLDLRVELLSYRRDQTSFWNAFSLSAARDEHGELAYVLACARDVTDERAAVQSREHSLAEKTALLHEVDHRVKNNLQLISSLLLLQSRRLDDEAARTAMRAMLGRVSAIATVHQSLFHSEEVGQFDIADFVRALAADLMADAGRSDIALRLDLEPVSAQAAQAAPLALMINELICNALQHAFPEGRGGRLEVELHRMERHFEVSVSDDGVGLSSQPAGRESFGLTMVDLLSRQVEAQWSVDSAQPGVRAVVKVPRPEAA